MEPFLVLGGLTAGTWWVGKRLYQAGRSARRRRAQQQRTDAAIMQRRLRARQQQQVQLRTRQQQTRKLNQKYKALQVALMQINKAPDFQRAASRAEASQVVPASLRQRQYRRFRPQLVHQFRRRLRAGTDAQVLLDSLTSLVEALGIAGFEAGYIQQEASRQTVNRNRQPTEDFSTSLERVQQEHNERTEALNQTSLDPDTKQQLLEAQNQRLVESLMEMTVGQQGEQT
jgi:hypothetical protein